MSQRLWIANNCDLFANECIAIKWYVLKSKQSALFDSWIFTIQIVFTYFSIFLGFVKKCSFSRDFFTIYKLQTQNQHVSINLATVQLQTAQYIHVTIKHIHLEMTAVSNVIFSSKNNNSVHAIFINSIYWLWMHW